MTILITGGAGFIGSHMVKMLRAANKEVLVLDDLSTGFESALLGAPWIKGSIGDPGILDHIFKTNQIDAVMNFASFIAVGESVENPAKYYLNNVANTLNLLDAMLRHEVKLFIFSSTAAVFGNPISIPIDEAHLSAPINPYGRSKHMIEQVLEDFDKAYAFKSVCLRYFNAAGADSGGELGERHDPETHLIPLVIRAASGTSKNVTIYGDDYETPDGTCIRDYVHIEDLCSAHFLALNHLISGGESRRYNLGNGIGFSVKQILDVAREVTGRPIEVKIESKRPGDAARLVADSKHIRTELGWKPKRSDIETIINDVWAWEKRCP